MNPNNGEITQDVPNGNFPGNSNGTYTVGITIADANGDGVNTGPGDYGPLNSSTKTTSITLGYANLNAGLKATTCLIDPTSIGTNIGTATNGTKVSGIW